MSKRLTTDPRATSNTLMNLEPRTPDHLHRFVRAAVGLAVPRTPIVPGSTAPFEYLTHTFFETHNHEAEHPCKDAVVWANRGGGKTMLGAVATLLDLVFKPGIQVRILGGSLEQSSKMFEHLIALFDRPWFRGLLDGEPTQRRISLINGSHVQLLAGSQRSIRGVRVQKLRCDEVDEFEPAVWEAAQMVTRSADCGGTHVHGAVEALSTMHRPFGLMSKLTDESTQSNRIARQFKWTAMDVIERCPPARPCEECVLWDDCRGRAKQAIGFIPVDDLVQQYQRSSRQAWSVEMMCRQPQVSDCVYPEFNLATHARESFPVRDTPYWIGGMDFGLRNPTVMLWACVYPTADSEQPTAVHVMDEYVRSGTTFEQNMDAIHRRAEEQGWPHPAWLGVDPAGHQRNSHTGISDVQALRRLGHTVVTKRSTLRDGIERVRRRLDRHTLFVHPRCQQLIEAMRQYHYDVSHPNREEPVKDGPDHLCDALRYMIVNLESRSEDVQARSYL